MLADAHQVRERRAQRKHPEYTKPQLVATAPNQVWSWDTTKLPGPTKGTYFTLYVILDIFSRYIVGWQVAARESATVAQELIKACCKQLRQRDDEVLGQLAVGRGEQPERRLAYPWRPACGRRAFGARTSCRNVSNRRESAQRTRVASHAHPRGSCPVRTRCSTCSNAARASRFVLGLVGISHDVALALSFEWLLFSVFGAALGLVSLARAKLERTPLQ